MDPLPGIAKVFSYAVQQERQINSNDMIGNNSLINAASTSSSNSGLSCTYCGKDNHTVDKCFKKNGFPQNYGSKGGKSNHSGFGKGNSSGKGRKLCTYCGFINHTVDEFYKKHGYPPKHKYNKSQSSNINNMNLLKKEVDGSASEQN